VASTARVSRGRAARLALGLLLVIAAALVWLLIVTLWAQGAGRAIPPIHSGSVAVMEGA
jgi:hypothetical protein